VLGESRGGALNRVEPRHGVLIGEWSFFGGTGFLGPAPELPLCWGGTAGLNLFPVARACIGIMHDGCWTAHRDLSSP